MTSLALPLITPSRIDDTTSEVTISIPKWFGIKSNDEVVIYFGDKKVPVPKIDVTSLNGIVGKVDLKIGNSELNGDYDIWYVVIDGLKNHSVSTSFSLQLRRGVDHISLLPPYFQDAEDGVFLDKVRQANSIVVCVPSHTFEKIHFTPTTDSAYLNLQVFEHGNVNPVQKKIESIVPPLVDGPLCVSIPIDKLTDLDHAIATCEVRRVSAVEVVPGKGNFSSQVFISEAVEAIASLPKKLSMPETNKNETGVVNLNPSDTVHITLPNTGAEKYKSGDILYVTWRFVARLDELTQSLGAGTVEIKVSDDPSTNPAKLTIPRSEISAAESARKKITEHPGSHLWVGVTYRLKRGDSWVAMSPIGEALIRVI